MGQGLEELKRIKLRSLLGRSGSNVQRKTKYAFDMVAY